MHASPNVVLGCTDCHGGNPARGLTKEQAHVLPRNKEFLENLRQSAELQRLAQSRIARVHPVHESRRSARGGAILRTLPRRDRSTTSHHSMMNHGAMLWGAALYNNGGVYLQRIIASARLTARTARRLRLINYTPVTPNDTAAARHPAVPRSAARASTSASRETSCASSRKAAKNNCSSAIPTVDEPPGKPARRLVRARPRHAQPHRPGFSRSAKNATARSAARLSRARTIIRAIIARAVARPATSFMRTIVRRRIPAGGANTATRA